ncbi:hypothetical protein AGMMS50262_17660 [Bacteroidia bacterium]|nr:hypothetical protein FACS189426_04010 [Bacteroidia bacterium]GHT27596.1 hypothetical protein FACS189432_04390 [Bacteroidia bacterium]GHT77215.1 hypothetical protein AGMMS50262_17660 [Bacteroidia bacterium]GHT85448.1 hypothetical protein FACS18947_4220 [Bacteroidia bacterium]GHV56159.1 hypothetical protein FACS1894182_02150 [Bacteroidia bacterium]
MFGIEDPGIYITYLMAFGCVVFALIYGIARWNEKDDDESINPENPEK